MFEFFFNKESKSNCSILGKRITPKISYDELQKQIADLHKSRSQAFTPTNTILANSLTQYWKPDKQKDWLLYKNIAITLALDYVKTKELNIFELYALLADCRHLIAVNLEQEDADQLGKVRELAVNYHITHLGNGDISRGIYESFIPLLLQKHNKNLLNKNVHSIMVDDVCVSEISFCDAEIPAGYLAFTIGHCKSEEKYFNLLIQKIEDEFQLFLKHTSNKDIMQSVAKILYYFVMAMPLHRGSAATTEMLRQVLFEGRGLRVEYKDENNLPMDLEAYFSLDINAFVSMFCSKLVLLEQHTTNPFYLKDNTEVCTIM